MEYSLDNFAELIRQALYDNFPYDPNSKSENIRDVAFYSNPVTKVDFGVEPYIMFDIGNETAERIAPYYHILQDAQVISKSHMKTISKSGKITYENKSTKKSRGSQAFIQDLGKRDYGRVSFNGKTYSQEYKKNVRGTRSKVDKATKFIEQGGRRIMVNRDSKYYVNTHYKYIDRILNEQLPLIAEQLGIKMRVRVISEGLESELNTQLYEDRISGAFALQPIEGTTDFVESMSDDYD